MREILFRGKRADNGEWAYGSLVKCRGYFYILEHYNKSGYDERWMAEEWVEVIPETVGQYVNTMDKTGQQRIFQYDIIELSGCDLDLIGLVDFEAKDGAGWVIAYAHNDKPRLFDEIYDEYGEICVTVIGNKFDNPDLLRIIYDDR